MDSLGKDSLGLLERASEHSGEPDACRLSEPAELDAAVGACGDPDPVETLDLILAGARLHPAGQQGGQHAVDARRALQVEPDSLRGGLYVPDPEGEFEEVPLVTENPVERLGLEQELRLAGGGWDERCAAG
ncbi:hypothetical protein [Streptomyces sp. NPDC029674]|uniref:hypothetical protein n=1 Tax=Streptomyces sp. NPDC029674 TaxID=3365297 RepID=UPI00384DCD35